MKNLKLITFASILFLSYFFYGLYISQIDLQIVSPALSPRIVHGYYDYKGVTHVHSNIGIGSGSIDEIVDAAQKSNLDFIFITDLNNFDNQTDFSGYHDNLLLLKGAKYSYLQSQLLYYPNESEKLYFTGLGDTQIFFADMLSQNNPKEFIVLSNPYSGSLQWMDQLAGGLTGIEVLNLKRIWSLSWENNKASFFWSAIFYPFHPLYSLIRLFEYPEKEFNLWDEMNQKRKTIGLLGNDISAKAVLMSKNFIQFPSYKDSFDIASNHVLLKSELTGNFKKDKEKILHALKNGNFYMSFDVLGDPRGFSIEMSDANQTYQMGSQISLSPKLYLKMFLPQPLKAVYEVELIKDGKVYSTSNSPYSEIKILVPGVYRVAVKVKPLLPLPDHKKWFYWIFSNSFYVANAAAN